MDVESHGKNNNVIERRNITEERDIWFVVIMSWFIFVFVFGSLLSFPIVYADTWGECTNNVTVNVLNVAPARANKPRCTITVEWMDRPVMFEQVDCDTPYRTNDDLLMDACTDFRRPNELQFTVEKIPENQRAYVKNMRAGSYAVIISFGVCFVLLLRETFRVNYIYAR